MNLLAAAPFWAAGVAASVVAWRRRPRRVRKWSGEWVDHDHRQRKALGANRVIGPCVYFHYDANGDCVYVGKAKVAARRFRQEAHERMADDFVWWWALGYGPRRYAEMEQVWIDRLQPRHNRQGVRR